MTNRVDTANVTVERVLYPKPSPLVVADNAPAWYILATNIGTAKGMMAWRPSDGERLRLEGRWDVYRGQKEFKFTVALPDVPVDPRDSLRYACERTIGMGPKLEEALWEKFGENWPDVRDGDLPRLRGDLYVRFREMLGQLAREAEKSNAIAWLMGRGSTPAMASAAWDRWEADTIGVVQGDCYRLAELPRYGFSHVDASVRGHFGIGDRDPRRIRACVLHAMRVLTERGDTAVRWEDLRDRANHDLRGDYSEMVAEHVRDMFGGSLAAFPDAGRVALGVDYEHEHAIWQMAVESAATDSGSSNRIGKESDR
jgi:hypothetical protein